MSWWLACLPPTQNAVDILALPLQLRAQSVGRVAVDEPGRVADDYVDLGLAEGDGADEVAGVVGPDVVTPLGVEAMHCGDGLLKGLPLSGIGDVVVIEGQRGVVAGLDGLGDVAHQGVEGLGALHEA